MGWQDGGTWWRSPGWPTPAWIMGNAPYLSHAGYKVSEMLRPNIPPMEMRSPGPRGLGLMVNPVDSGSTGPLPFQNWGGAVYTSAGGGPVISPSGGGGLPAPPAATPAPSQQTQTSNPVFYDQNQNVITSAICGAVYSMTVPGYEGKTLFVQQTKNGAPQFSGNLQIPMTNYASKCQQDEGSYQISVHDPASGALIGATTFTVLPAAVSSAAGTAVTTAPGSSTGTTGATTPTTAAPAAASFLSNLSGVDWILILLLGAVVLSKR